MKRKILALIVVFLLGVSCLYGCGNSKNTDSPKNNNEVSEKATKQTTLSIISWQKIPQELIDKFEKENPDIKVQYENFPGSAQYNDVFRARLAGGEDLDIITWLPENTEKMVNDGLLVELTNEPFIKNFRDDLVELAKNRAGDDKVYYVCFENVKDGIWYNKDIFNKYKLNVPTNFDEFLNVCETLQKNGVTPLIAGGKDGWCIGQAMFPIKYAYAKNSNYGNDLNTGKIKWNEDPVIAECIGRIEKTIKYYDKNTMGLSYDQAFQAFLAQKAAMWPMGSWAVELIKDPNNFKSDFNIGFMATIDNPDSTEKPHMTLALDSRCMGICSKSKHVDESKRFFEFYSKTENAQKHADIESTMLNVKGVKATGLFMDQWDAIEKTAQPISEWSSVLKPSIVGTFVKDTQAMFAGAMDAKELLNDLQKQQEIENNK